jgi:CubicO group peptidase (beta-lactamase class C family)
MTKHTSETLAHIHIDTYLETTRRALNLPGLACAIIQGNQLLYAQGFGHAGPARPVSPQTPFILGSLSKSFTALAAMQLVDAGKLNLDDPAKRYIPWLRFETEAAEALTIRHLLTHTSGISRYDGRALLSERASKTIEQRVRERLPLKLSRPVGSTYQYSNTNYLLASLIVEIAAGIPFATYLQEHILLPLSMNNSATSEAAAKQKGLSEGYRWWYGTPYAFSAPYLDDALGAAFVAASAEDLARWLLLHLNGQVDEVSILSQDGLTELHRATVPTGKGTQAAMGWRVGQLAGEQTLQHGGEVSNFRSDMLLLPAHHLGLVVLANCNNGFVAQLGLDQIAPDLARFLLNQPHTKKRLQLRAFGLLEAEASLILVALVIWLWVALLSNTHFMAGGVVALTLASTLPALALWRLPKLADMPWKGLRLYVPDLGNLVWWLSIISLVLAGVSLLRWLI